MTTVESSNSDLKSNRQPPLTQSDAITSLLSLSLAAADADLSGLEADAADEASTSVNSTTTTTSLAPTTVVAAGGKHHRRLGSTGKTRRRLSDAREASARPLLVPATSSAALSLASLSLSTSPPSTGHGHAHSHSLGQSQSYAYPPLAIKPRPSSNGQGIPIVSASAPNGGVAIPMRSAGSYGKEEHYVGSGNTVAASENGDGDDELGEGGEKGATPIPVGGKAKKRGVDYKCESCAKIYRHPNCLNKHRWEHTRQWREASKFVLSKHQQVQLLEAAAILSYMGTSSTSLPEDRSEWPSFLSGGSLPKVDAVGGMASSQASSAPHGMKHYMHPGSGNTSVPRSTTTYALHPQAISSSVPNVPSGPRMHDYSLPAAGVPVKVTQVRPGLLGVPTPGSTSDHAHTIIGGDSAGVGSGGWSIPNSSLRSASYSSRSRSGSGSGSRSRSGSRSDESVDVEVDVEGMDEDDVRVADHVGIIKGTPGSFTGYATTPGLSHSPGYGYAYAYGAGHVAGYGYGHGFARRGAGMKREEDEMSVGFSVREEDEDEEDGADGADVRQKQILENKWNGMEMELDMDMD